MINEIIIRKFDGEEDYTCMVFQDGCSKPKIFNIKEEIKISEELQ